MTRTIYSTDYMEISVEIERIQNMANLLLWFFEKAPARDDKGKIYERKRDAFAYEAPTYNDVLIAICTFLRDLKDSVDATIEEQEAAKHE